MKARVAVLVAALALLTACSAALDFHQCDSDGDCLRFMVGDVNAFCTADHICVSDFPKDRIACELSASSQDVPEALTIAGLFRRTGPNDVVDTDLEHAAELAVGEINQLQERPLRLILCDTAGDPLQARSALAVAAERFGAVAAVGPTSSDELVALASAPDNPVKKHGVLVVSCSATSPRITSLDDDNLIWRTAASDALQAQVLATLVPSDTSKVATACVDSNYGLGLKGAFAESLGVLFPNPPLIPISSQFKAGTPGADIVAFLQGEAPQVAMIVADSDAPTWIAALGGGGPTLAATQYLLTDGSKAPSLFSQSPSMDVLTRITGTAPATPSGAAFNAFSGSYMGSFHRDPSNTAFVANAYDAVYAIALAMGDLATLPANEVTGRLLIRGMQRLSDPGGLSTTVGPNGFGPGYERLADGGSLNLEGTSGPIDFDPSTGDIRSAPIEIWNIDTSGAAPTFRTLRNVTP